MLWSLLILIRDLYSLFGLGIPLKTIDFLVSKSVQVHVGMGGGVCHKHTNKNLREILGQSCIF